MKERPILFSGPMVNAILAGTKTQTRRLLKSPHVGDADVWTDAGNDLWQSGVYGEGGALAHGETARCPYGVPGDRLLVAVEIPSSPNRDYCAGTDGKIYSRTRYAGAGRKDRVDWYPMTPSAGSKGYPMVSLCHENKKITRTVHSLICESFYGARPISGAQVRHLDGNRENSAPLNLAWGTQADNWADRKAHGNGCDGQKHHAAKLDDAERAHVRWAIEHNLCSRRHAANALGMSASSVSALMHGAAPDRIPRITLEVTAVRVERLQEISDEDAEADGIPAHVSAPTFAKCYPDLQERAGKRIECFERLWDGINGKRAPWESNPWVFVLGFRRLEAK